MLRHLHIKNFTLIDTLDIDFFDGFSVITGETGAGKSIILGAIGLLLGQRADSKVIRNQTSKCIIEAHFDISRYGMEAFFKENDIDYDAEDCIIRRELSPSGKSRAFINDCPVALSTLKDLSDHLIDIHSQHQNLLLNKQDFQLNVVDIIAHNSELLEAYQQQYATYHQAQKRLVQLREDIERNRANADFLQFQFQELDDARLSTGEQEELEQKADILSHSEEIKSHLFQIDNLLSAEGSGVVDHLHSVLEALHTLSRHLPEADEMAERVSSCHIELKDLAHDISTKLEDTDFDPALLDSINSRLDRIYDLEKKYRVEHVEQLLELKAQLQTQLDHIINSDDALQTLQEEVDQAEAACRQTAGRLHEERVKAARLIEQEMLERLITLGMPNVRFIVHIQPCALCGSGTDHASFLFSANKSQTPQPVSQVASGGEIARVMLSLKAMISSAVKLPTIIFDEIDTGVSGKIAECMAQIMQQMGACGRQVISITHLPQIAALGSNHYKVVKTETEEGTASNMKQLDADERIREIAQMLSGSDISEAAISNAKELLKRHQTDS